MNMGARPMLPCEGSNEPCTRFSISRDPSMGAAELSDCNVKRVHALTCLKWARTPTPRRRFQGRRDDLRLGLSRCRNWRSTCTSRPRIASAR